LLQPGKGDFAPLQSLTGDAANAQIVDRAHGEVVGNQYPVVVPLGTQQAVECEAASCGSMVVSVTWPSSNSEKSRGRRRSERPAA